MSHKEMMLEELQPFQRKSKVFHAIFQATGHELNKRDLIHHDLSMQLNVDTATWALSIYEKELDVKIDLHKPLSERRAIIKSKMRGTGKVDAALIKLVASSYSNGEVEVTVDRTTSIINIQFTGTIGIPSNLDDLKKAVNEIKPAHLAVMYSFAYLLIRDVSEMTIAELALTELGNFAGGGLVV